MNKKLVQTLGIKVVILTIWLFSSFSSLVYATWEVSLQDLRNSVSFSKEDVSLIGAAMKKVNVLKSDIDQLTEELFNLDETQKSKSDNLSENYRQARIEIVKVISSINSATNNIADSLQKLVE